ncbi:MAG: hypothetical protein Q4G05_00715 [Clostridia bacterium]|nr:hypothetical protein [Clostridia bacterium]
MNNFYNQSLINEFANKYKFNISHFDKLLSLIKRSKLEEALGESLDLYYRMNKDAMRKSFSEIIKTLILNRYVEKFFCKGNSFKNQDKILRMYNNAVSCFFENSAECVRLLNCVIQETKKNVEFTRKIKKLIGLQSKIEEPQKLQLTS